MSAITDMLLLVDVEVPEADVQAWDAATRNAVVDWATKTYLDASDNDVEVPPRPAVLAPYTKEARAAAAFIERHVNARDEELAALRAMEEKEESSEGASE